MDYALQQALLATDAAASTYTHIYLCVHFPVHDTVHCDNHILRGFYLCECQLSCQRGSLGWQMLAVCAGGAAE